MNQSLTAVIEEALCLLIQRHGEPGDSIKLQYSTKAIPHVQASFRGKQIFNTTEIILEGIESNFF